MKSVLLRGRGRTATATAAAWMAAMAMVVVLFHSSSSTGRGSVVVESFAPPPPTTTSRRIGAISVVGRSPRRVLVLPSATSSSDDEAVADRPAENESPNDAPPTLAPRRRSLFSSMPLRGTRPVAFAVLTAASSLLLPSAGFGGRPHHRGAYSPVVGVPSASAAASTPIVLRAAQKKEDPPMVQAAKKAEELRKKKSLEDFDAFMERANDVESSGGKAAREAYEKQYHLERRIAETNRANDVLRLRRELLDGGMDPHADLDAERQVYLLEHGVDLEKVSGTPHNENMIKNFQRRGNNKKRGAAASATLEHQRYIVKCQVADLKARGVDPMEHFADPEVVPKTRAIYRMEDKVAERVAKQYEKLMEEHGGRLSPRKEGEGPPFAYPDVIDVDPTSASDAASASASGGGGGGAETRAAIKARRAAEREAARSERAQSKSKAKAERVEGRERTRAEKVAARERRSAEKAAAAAASAAGAAAASAAVSSSAATATSVATLIAGDGITDDGIAELTESGGGDVVVVRRQGPSAAATNLVSVIGSRATAKNIGAVVITGGAAAYGFNYYRDNNAAAKKERERQLRLILGNDGDDDDDDDEDEEDDGDFEDDEDDDLEQFTSTKVEEKKQQKSKPEATTASPLAPPTASTPPPPPPAAPKPKRTLGIFSKRNADARPTDINVLVGPSARAPELAALLAQILTYGAPGRFPRISSWKMRPMPFDVYDSDEAKRLLTEAREDAELTDEESAEIFASVVNCMIIDIVDLASSTLKIGGGKKDKDESSSEKVTVDAINVVMDFMDHAASLFDAVSKDITIKPVTYGGSLRKKDLEQMFSIYAGSSVLSLDGSGSGQDRVDTLQLVFGIADKKAEGLMQKHMMKMVMNMMKDGGKGLEGMEGMEGMEEMMKAMGGGGMPGMPGMDGEMNPEDLKQTLGMMRDLMESGQVSKEELGEVRKQFREMYGSDISDLIKKASEEGAAEDMTVDERELLDLFKQILGDD